MKDTKQLLMLKQMDAKLQVFTPLLNSTPPPKGWLNAVRKTFKMSLRQFGERLGITAPSAEGLEKREVEKTITLKSLEQAGNALNMKLVYGFVPIDGSLEKTIENRAKELAIEIVKTTSHTMALEDQANSNERLKQAVEEKVKQLMYEMPRYLWD